MIFTVVQFPDGSWSYGGKPDSPEYADCKVVYRIVADTAREAVKIGQRRAARERAKERRQKFMKSSRYIDGH